MTQVTKPKVSEISDQIQKALRNSTPEFQDLLKTTSTWEYHEKRLKSQYKELTGSEKQIAWAKKIREEKTNLFLIGHVSAIWDMNAQKRGERGFGIKMTEEEHLNLINARAKKFKFLFSSQASVIIDNRF